jgi:hypothetical protein
VFRVIRQDDLSRSRAGRESLSNDLRQLAVAGLVERRTIHINQDLTKVVVLSREGKRLLDAHRDVSPGVALQVFHAGISNRRALAHDAQLFRMYQGELAAIEARGGRVTRVVIDAELAREYSQYRQRPRAEGDADRETDAEAFAHAHDLPMADGHIKFPDVRIEFEVDGRVQRRDLELVTEHYSRASIAAKTRAGFAIFCPAGARGGRGGTPADPHHLRRLA